MLLVAAAVCMYLHQVGACLESFIADHLFFSFSFFYFFGLVLLSPLHLFLSHIFSKKNRGKIKKKKTAEKSFSKKKEKRLSFFHGGASSSSCPDPSSRPAPD